MIWVASGSSLAFQRLSRDSIFAILSIRLAESSFAVAPPDWRDREQVGHIRCWGGPRGGGGGFRTLRCPLRCRRSFVNRTNGSFDVPSQLFRCADPHRQVWIQP
eukprot:gene24216-biopygen10421